MVAKQRDKPSKNFPLVAGQVRAVVADEKRRLCIPRSRGIWPDVYVDVGREVVTTLSFAVTRGHESVGAYIAWQIGARSVVTIPALQAPHAQEKNRFYPAFRASKKDLPDHTAEVDNCTVTENKLRHPLIPELRGVLASSLISSLLFPLALWAMGSRDFLQIGLTFALSVVLSVVLTQSVVYLRDNAVTFDTAWSNVGTICYQHLLDFLTAFCSPTAYAACLCNKKPCPRLRNQDIALESHDFSGAPKIAGLLTRETFPPPIPRNKNSA